jgi:holin-like protein
MIGALSLLFVCEFAGDAISRLLGLPLPGSVVGMVILLLWLASVKRDRPVLGQVTGWLTAHLSVMFVPAAVGLIVQGPVLSRYGVGILVAATVSTLLTLVVTVLVFQGALRLVERPAPIAQEKSAVA